MSQLENTHKQRVVNKNLGKNNSKDHIQIYDEIEKIIGKTKKCNFGHIRGSKTGVKHEGSFEVNIRDFELQGVSVFNNEVIIKKGDGLQSFCRNCSKLRRRVRIDTSRKEKANKTPEEIYESYKLKYGINLKKCSRCETDKELNNFTISVSMECGIHNICKICSCEYGESVGDRWIIFMPDGYYKYKKVNANEHDDHIFPLSLGGSNEKINHQLLSSADNLKKSNSISHFTNVENIDINMLSERYRKYLKDVNDLTQLKIVLSKSIYDDIMERSKLTDAELYTVYDLYCKKYNLRKDVNRAVKKFREYCKLRI
jgi:hypothetical protein